MTYLFYLLLLIVPLITYNKSIDSFVIKTLLISITGFAALGYWITKEWRGIASIPLYFFWLLISYIFCKWPLGHPGEEVLLMLSYLGIFLLSRDYLNRESIVNILMISLAITVGYNFYINHSLFNQIKNIYHMRIIWHNSSFVNVRIYSGWLCLLIPLVFAKALKHGLFYWVLFFFSLLAIVCTGGRSSMLGLAAALAAFSAFRWGKMALIPIIWFWVLFSLLGWFYLPHEILDPSRAHFWSGTLDLMASNPWTGNGIGSFSTVYPLFKENIMQGADPNHLLVHCHNFSFEMISEIGIIGLLLFLFMIWKIWKQADKKDPLNLALIAAMFGCLVDNFYNITFYYSAVGMIFWLYLGLLASNKKREEKKHEGWMARIGEWSDYCFYN